MLITDFLSSANVLPKLSARSKDAILEALARHAAGVLGVDHRPMLTALLDREALGSTGMGSGMAMPHAYLPDLGAPLGILATLKSPVDFNAVDGKPVDIVFLLLLSSNRRTSPLNAMACAARRLRDPDVVGGLLAAANAKELYKAVRNGSREGIDPAIPV